MIEDPADISNVCQSSRVGRESAHVSIYCKRHLRLFSMHDLKDAMV